MELSRVMVMVPTLSEHYHLSSMKEKPRAPSSSIPRDLRPSSKELSFKRCSGPKVPHKAASLWDKSQPGSLYKISEAKWWQEQESHQAVPLALATAPCNSSGPPDFGNPKGSSGSLPRSMPAAFR